MCLYLCVCERECVCSLYNIYIWMFAMMMSGYEWFSFSRERCFRDRKCVWDGKHLLTRYDKPPKHFQFWSIHTLFFFHFVGWWVAPTSFIIRIFLFAVLPLFWHSTLFFWYFLRLCLLKPIFHYELMYDQKRRIKYLKLHTWFCCYCWWWQWYKMHFMDGKSKHLIAWYYISAV